MTQYSYSFSYGIRDFTPVMRLLMERKPSILSIFRQERPRTNNTFYYYDDIDQPVSAVLNGTVSNGNTVFTTDGEVGSFAAGDQVVFKDDHYEVLTVVTQVGHTLTLTGSSAYTHDDNTVVLKVGTPRVQGSSASAEDVSQGTPRTNYTQIFRKDISIAGTQLQIGNEDYNDDIISRGVSRKMEQLYREMATTFIYGKPVASSNGVAGKTAGIMYWLDQSDGLKYDKAGATLTPAMLNDAIEVVYNKGGDPDVIVCSSATARKISAFNTATTNQMIVVSENTITGAGIRQVSQFTGDLTGTGTKKILVEPNMPDASLLILSSNDLAFAPLGDRTMVEWDSTSSDFDGVQRSMLGEYGTIISNPYYSHVLIYDFAV